MRLAVVFAWVLAMVLATGVANADDLARAHQLEAQLEYDQALALVEAMLARGGAEPARYAELQLFAGKLAAGLDRVRLAEDHYVRALAVRPATTLPEGTSPKLTEPFARARARAQPLTVAATNRHGLVALELGDPLGLVVGISVHVVVAGEHADRVERGAVRLAVPANATVVDVAALDASGNRLWSGAPRVDAERRPTPTTPHGDAPIYARWTTYAMITGVALAAGGLAAWRFDRAQSEWNSLRAEGADFSALEAVEDRGRRWGLAANVGFGIGAAAGIATIVFAIRGSSSVIVTPTANGAGVSGRF